LFFLLDFELGRIYIMVERMQPVFIGCGPLDSTNAWKHSIDQSEDRILQINQSKKDSYI